MQELDNNEGGGGGISGGGKRWLHSLDHYRRLKDEDPIIPFSEGPIISKWGAISRASRTSYHNTDPVQATACQSSASTTPINFRGEERYTEIRDLLEVRTNIVTKEQKRLLSSVKLLKNELVCL